MEFDFVDGVLTLPTPLGEQRFTYDTETEEWTPVVTLGGEDLGGGDIDRFVPSSIDSTSLSSGEVTLSTHEAEFSVPDYRSDTAYYTRVECEVRVRTVEESENAELAGTKRTVVTINTAALDRHGTEILPRGAMLKNYRKNPVVFVMHNPYLTAGKSKIKVHGDRISATMEEKDWDLDDPLIIPWHNKVVNLGIVRMASIGFRPVKWERIKIDPEGPDYGRNIKIRITKWELLEWSWVPIGSNFEALVESRDLDRARGFTPTVRKFVHDLQHTTPEALPALAQRWGGLLGTPEDPVDLTESDSPPRADTSPEETPPVAVVEPVESRQPAPPEPVGETVTDPESPPVETVPAERETPPVEPVTSTFSLGESHVSVTASLRDGVIHLETQVQTPKVETQHAPEYVREVLEAIRVVRTMAGLSN